MKNKEVEKIIKNSIKIDNLDFFDKLPEVKDKKNYKYKYILCLTIVIFTIIIININSSKFLSNKINDSIIFNTISIKDKLNNNTQLELIYDYKLREANLDSINKYYNINMSKNNLIASSYITYDDDKNTIVGYELTYSHNSKNIKVNISDNLENLNVLTNGLINVLNNNEKSIISEKQIVLAKFKDAEYPKYIMYEHESNDRDYYFALYIKDDLYYYITSNDINEEEFIKFLKDIIL